MAREARDAYSTPDETALRCVRALYEHHPELQGRPVVEPSAGGGAFLRALAADGRSGSVSAFDLEPQAEGIQKANFLEIREHFEPGTVVIGNPPYGYKNDLTRKFVDQAFELGADRVAFLLMASTMGYGTLKRIGRKVESWHSLSTVFYRGDVTHRTGSVLDTLAWVVFSREPLQEIGAHPFSLVPIAERARADFSSSVIYGRPEIDFQLPPDTRADRNVREYRTVRSGRPRIYFLYTGDGAEAKQIMDTYPITGLNQTPAATSLNWHAEHGPSLYRGRL